MRAFAIATISGLALGLLVSAGLAAQSAPSRAVSADQYERWKKELSNWG